MYLCGVSATFKFQIEQNPLQAQKCCNYPIGSRQFNLKKNANCKGCCVSESERKDLLGTTIKIYQAPCALYVKQDANIFKNRPVR